MIDLLAVKRNGTYDFVQDTLPATDGTWLCTLTATLYTIGHSYNVESGEATRIEEIQDAKIEDRIHETIKSVFDWLNNPFYASRSAQQTQDWTWAFDQNFFSPVELSRKWNAYESDASFYTYASSVITGIQDNVFVVGDLVQIEGSLRNNVVGYVTAQADGTITIDNTDVRDTAENAVIFLSDVPKQVERTISSMIYFDVFDRVISDKKSESIGNYSYTNEDPVVGGIAYPNDIVGGLETYRRMDFVA